MSKYRKYKGLVIELASMIYSLLFTYLLARYTMINLITIIFIHLFNYYIVKITMISVRFEPIKKPSSHPSKMKNLTKVLEKSIF